MAYAAYEHYKQSGIKTIGLMPQHWSIRRLKFMARIQNGKDYKGVVSHEGYPVIGSGGEFAKANTYLYNGESVLLGRKGTIDRPLYINGPFWTVDTMFYTEISDDVSAKYLYYCSLTINFLKYATSTALPSMTQQDLGTIPFAVPEYDEQQTIASFLNFKTAQIDALISKQKDLLDKLAEKRTALISHAVSKGLDLSVPMKDSGVDWLGEIPKHWTMTRLRFVTTCIEQGWSPQCNNQPASEEQWGVLKVGCVNSESFDENENKSLPDNLEPRLQYEVKSGDILVSRANTKALLGSAALINQVRPRLLLCDKLYRIKTNSLVEAGYLVRFMRSTIARFHYEKNSTGTSGSMQNIGQDTLKDLPIPLPPKDEQVAILKYLESKSTTIKLSEEKIASVIAKLIEYRASLITNAVTGKIDVRDFSIPEQRELQQTEYA
ncbi:restriction endonuclease subunit S [Brenneria sp. g21c3]|uniref:restriction endonuclease subunit S n=1 Tax=Brenneria sp. g21c3 TaxID=3093893 RepID=UPI002EAA7315|nr:restriction endonuclease subunit S [Brenneria sp. g21c3]